MLKVHKDQQDHKEVKVRMVLLVQQEDKVLKVLKGLKDPQVM